MIRIAVTLLMLAMFGREVLAASGTPRLKELVTITAEIVRIGDLVENAGAAANIPVFRAPDLGHTGAVSALRVAEALRMHDIAEIDTHDITEVVVTRLSRPITGKDVTERIARAVAGQFGFGDAANISVAIDREVRTFHVEATAMADLAVTRMFVEPRNGRFDISLEVPGSNVARRMPLRFTGTASETVEIATVTRALRQGELIKKSDLTIERRAKSVVSGDGLLPDQAVGMAAKNPLRAGQLLRYSDVVKPLAVQRSEPVTIYYETPGIMLTVRGKATEAGAVGDVITVLNVQSNRTVHATVSGPGRVTVAAALPIVAAATSPVADQTPVNTQ